LEFCEGDNGAGLGGGTLPNAGPPAVSPQSAGKNVMLHDPVHSS